MRWTKRDPVELSGSSGISRARPAVCAPGKVPADAVGVVRPSGLIIPAKSSSSMNDSPPQPSRLLKISAACAKWALGLLAGCVLLLALAWGALHGWIVPRIADYRPAMERQASRALGVPVRIGN